MNDRQYIASMDSVVTAFREPSAGRYPYRMRIQVTQLWDLDIKADDEDDAYAKAERILLDGEWQAQAELDTEEIEATHCFDL